MSPAPPEAQTDFWVEAHALISKQQYGQALEVLEQAAQNNPGNPDILIAIGQIYLAQQRWLLAEDAFNRALARAPDKAQAVTGLAEAMLHQGNRTQALKFWQQATTLDPKVPGGFSGLGRTHLSFFNFAAAQAAFLSQLEQGEDFEARWYLAALLAPHDLAAALTHLQAIPSPDEANLPASLLTRRDYLVATLSPFAVNSPQVEIAKSSGIALAQIEAWPLAIHALEIAREGAPAEAETVVFLAHARAQAGQPALDLFRQAHTLDPTSALPLYFQAIYLRQQAAFAAAEDLLRQASTLDPKNAAILVEWAKIKEQQGNLATAEVLYLAAIEVAEEKVGFQRLLLRFYVNRNYLMREAGIPLAEELLEANAEDAEVYDLLGWLQFLSGAPDGGEPALKKAIALDPTLVSAHYHLGRYWESTGQSALAETAYQRVIDWDVSNHFRNQALKDLRRLQTQ